MDDTEKEIVKTLIERLKGVEARERAFAVSLRQLTEAFCGSRPEFQQKYYDFRQLAESSVSAHLADDLDRIYGDMLQRLQKH